MQERTLGLYLEQLDISIEYLRTNQREKCRLYTSLGIMGGMFLVIVDVYKRQCFLWCRRSHHNKGRTVRPDMG